MRFKLILCLVLGFSAAFAERDKLSPIVLPQGEFLNIYSDKCDNSCLNALLQKELYFSFLSRYNDAISDKYTQENYLIYGQMFNIFFTLDTKTTRLALLVPQKSIRNYAVMTANAISAYLLRQSNDFELAVFNSGDESEESIIAALNEIRKNGYTYVIAPITQEGLNALASNSDGLQLFVPTLHKSFFDGIPPNIIFGGIDYSAQIKALDGFAANLTYAFSDDSKLGLSLNEMVKKQDKLLLQEVVLSSTKESLKKVLEKNKQLNSSSVYLNTPPIMTSLIASQLRISKYEPHSLLSTQINYQPSLLMFSQYEDRKDLYLANSIGKIDPQLESINAFLGNNLEYEYVNYAASIGAEYFSRRFFNSKQPPLFEEQIEANTQVEYHMKIYRASRYGFSLQKTFISDFLSETPKDETADDEILNDAPDEAADAYLQENELR